MLSRMRLQVRSALEKPRTGPGSPSGRRPDVKYGDRLAMKPIGTPVRRNIAAMTPNGAELHAAERLPDLAAALDVSTRVDDFAGRSFHTFRHRRSLAMDLAANE